MAPRWERQERDAHAMARTVLGEGASKVFRGQISPAPSSVKEFGIRLWEPIEGFHLGVK